MHEREEPDDVTDDQATVTVTLGIVDQDEAEPEPEPIFLPENKTNDIPHIRRSQ